MAAAGEHDLGPVVVELGGITPPTRFKRLSTALRALALSMSALPLDAFQADCYRYYLTRPDAVERAAENLERDGNIALSFTLHDAIHVLSVRVEEAQPPQPTTSPR